MSSRNNDQQNRKVVKFNISDPDKKDTSHRDLMDKHERKKIPNYSSNMSNISEENKTTITNKNTKDFYSFYINNFQRNKEVYHSKIIK